MQRMDLEYIMIAEKEDKKYVIEVKAARNLLYSGQYVMQAVHKLTNATEVEGGIPVLVVLNQMRESMKDMLHIFDHLEILDIHNLLYMVKDNDKLKSDLVAFLNYSVDNIEIVKPSIVETNEKSSESDLNIDALIQQFTEWISEDHSYIEYEDLCIEALGRLFDSDLTLWKKQQQSNDGLFRFDLICKIKEGTEQEFWRMAERYFSSKYIVFEFKNYKDRIGQGQVYTTEKYLYRKGLRGVAILISVKGIDENGEKAIRGVLREEGKLIISLSNEDLVKMLETKKRYGQPADYLSEKLDELLIDLEK